jgi:Tyrosine phosphatase family
MRVRRLHKLIIFFLFFIILFIFLPFTFIKIWGEKLLVKDLYRQGLVFSEGMTISEFGNVNQLKSPLLKSVFGLTSDEDFQKKLGGLSLDQKEVLNQINNKLLLQARSENILLEWFDEINRSLLRNFGLVTRDIQRSGQPKPAVLWLHYQLFPFKSVINLAWEPENCERQVFEKTFCEKRNIDYYNFSWDAHGPKDWREVDQVIEIIEKCQKPVWIHCMGGRDRTGGLVAMWKKKKGYPTGLIFADFQAYGIPAFTWVQQIICENPSDVQSLLSPGKAGVLIKP